MNGGVTWLTSVEVAGRTRRSVRAVNRAAAEGAIHSHQATVGGKRVFAEPVIDLWLQGANKTAQREACGCMQVVPARRAG